MLSPCWVPFCQKGPQNGPQIGPKLEPKSGDEINTKQDEFRGLSGCSFGRIPVYFRCKNGVEGGAGGKANTTGKKKRRLA